MDLRHPGCDELSSPLAIHTAMAKGEKGGTDRYIRYTPLEMDSQCSVLLQILLRVSLPWGHIFELLEAELALLGTAASQVLCLARLFRPLLDG
jgi:hypothetical protein